MHSDFSAGPRGGAGFQRMLVGSVSPPNEVTRAGSPRAAGPLQPGEEEAASGLTAAGTSSGFLQADV